MLRRKHYLTAGELQCVESDPRLDAPGSAQDGEMVSGANWRRLPKLMTASNGVHRSVLNILLHDEKMRGGGASAAKLDEYVRRTA
jgi:hypothetical protein